MKQKGIDAFILPHSDPHIGENIPEYWEIISWLTGFTGSAATVVITDSFTGLWTDSRYFLQAAAQLDGTGFELMGTMPGEPKTWTEWLEKHLGNQKIIGFDGRIFPLSDFNKIDRKLKNNKVTFNTCFDPVAGIWTDRPSMPAEQAWDFPVKYAGRDRSAKIEDIRKEMLKYGADFHLLTAPDDIMWMLNIRGNDLQYSPLCLSFALAGKQQVLLFTDEKKIPAEIAGEFDRIGVVILPYDECQGVLSSLTDKSSILIDPSGISVSMYNSIPRGFRIIEDLSIPARLKAIKNNVEIENIGQVMIRDGVALTRLFHWIESNRSIVPMSECSIGVRLHELRARDKDYLGPSFQSIVAYNENSAMPHYTVSPETDAILGENGILLIDSGGQYLGGTTDITRTISIAVPTQKQRTDFTLVLKGHIAVACARFPYGTKGYQIDMLARKALWEKGLNYGHGTGHGVGYCLNVHEGPQSISPADNKTSIESGMLISNEPALYRDGEYGIRTENLILCYLDEETGFGDFLKFDTVSLCYLDRSLIDRSLLEKKEIDWINSYHTEVYEKLSPLLTKEEAAWLKEKTEMIN